MNNIIIVTYQANYQDYIIILNKNPYFKMIIKCELLKISMIMFFKLLVTILKSENLLLQIQNFSFQDLKKKN